MTNFTFRIKPKETTKTNYSPPLIRKHQLAFGILLFYTLICSPIMILLNDLTTSEGSKKPRSVEITATVIIWTILIYTILQWYLLYKFNKSENTIGRRLLIFLPVVLVILTILLAPDP